MIKYWYKVEKDLFIIFVNSEYEDYRAVLCSKTSRSIFLEEKSKRMNKKTVEQFLKKNLSGYGHSSIAEMAFPTVFSRGFGWISAWLLEDDPLFIGQEVSTRAVDLSKFSCEICYDSIDIFPFSVLKKYHDLFLESFLMQKKNIEKGLLKGYKFDDIRFLLPGTIITGVTISFNARAVIRHLSRLQKIDFMSKVVQKYQKAVRMCCSNVYDTFCSSKYLPMSWWKQILVEEIKKKEEFFCIEYLGQNLADLSFFSRQKQKEYIDPLVKKIGLFKVRFLTSIGCARDFHRHRTCYPIILSLPVFKKQPFLFPFYKSSLSAENSEKFFAVYEEFSKFLINKKSIKFSSLYLLPFGTACILEMFVTLDKLVYMLELRYFSSNAMKVYKNTAKFGLLQLIKIIGKKNSENLKIFI